MVFLGGPRQVGKTTLALSLIPGADETHPAYLSRDVPASQQLLLRGGLPADQPLIILDEIHKQDTRHWKRWQRERQSRVIQEDLISLEQVREVSQLQLLAQLLPQRVGSVLSIANLRQDLSVAFETADKWVTIFENLYYCFRIMPYGLPQLRAVKNGKPEFAVECKSGGRALGRNIAYFAQRTAIPKFYQTHLEAGGQDTEWPNARARIIPFVRLCELLKL